MPKVLLSCPEIVANVRQVEATRVAEHMRMHAAQASNSTGLANDEVHGLPCELALALGEQGKFTAEEDVYTLMSCRAFTDQSARGWEMVRPWSQ